MMRRRMALVLAGALWSASAGAGSPDGEALDLYRQAQPQAGAKADASAFVADVLRQQQADRRRPGWNGWAAGVKPPPVAVPAAAASRPIATEKGVDLDALLARYQGPMRQAQQAKWRYPEVLVFVSWSMPKETIAAYMRDAKAAGAVLVLRGLKDGSAKATVAAVRDLGRAATGMLVDPRLYRMFKVDVVPTVVVSQGHVVPCHERGCTEAPPPFDKIEGNIGLGEALRRIGEDGEVREVAAAHLARLRGGR